MIWTIFKIYCYWLRRANDQHLIIYIETCAVLQFCTLHSYHSSQSYPYNEAHESVFIADPCSLLSFPQLATIEISASYLVHIREFLSLWRIYCCMCAFCLRFLFFLTGDLLQKRSLSFHFFLTFFLILPHFFVFFKSLTGNNFGNFTNNYRLKLTTNVALHGEQDDSPKIVCSRTYYQSSVVYFRRMSMRHLWCWFRIVQLALISLSYEHWYFLRRTFRLLSPVTFTAQRLTKYWYASETCLNMPFVWKVLNVKSTYAGTAQVPHRKQHPRIIRPLLKTALWTTRR